MYDCSRKIVYKNYGGGELTIKNFGPSMWGDSATCYYICYCTSSLLGRLMLCSLIAVLVNTN